MNREDLINKWLNNELSDQEVVDLQNLEDYDALKKIVDSAKHFGHEESFSEEDIDKLLSNKEEKSSTRKLFLSNKWLRVAAVLVVGMGIFLMMTLNSDVAINSANGETVSFLLPDNSSVELNADSEVTYTKSNWEKNRSINLSGEALFQVEKGDRFKVKTDIGSVQVLGTTFNVFQRGDHFEITCFEGSVQVLVQNDESVLKKGEGVRLNPSGKLEKFYSDYDSANWLDGFVRFENKNILFVVDEIERQFDVKIVIADESIISKHFSGTIFFEDLNVAMKTLKSSLTIDYKIINEEGKVILSEIRD